MLHKHSISPHLTSYPAQFYVSHNIKLYVKVLKRRLFLRFCEDPSVLPVNIQHVNIFNTAPVPMRVFLLKKVWPGSTQCHQTTSCIGQSNTCKFHIPGGSIYQEKLVYFFISVQCFGLWIRLYMYMQGWTSLLYVLGALCITGNNLYLLVCTFKDWKYPVFLSQMQSLNSCPLLCQTSY